LGKILVLSLIAVGANSIKTPILQINSNKRKGITLNMIENIFVKFL
jgi:hypothetical protein